MKYYYLRGVPVMKVPRSIDDLNDQLKEQLYFLKVSAASYDAGQTIEAKRLATTMRNLFHDTKHTKSLLSQLGVKKKLYYYNTAIPETQFGLTGIMTTTAGGGKTEFYPPLDEGGPKRKERPWIIFQEWWEEMNVLYDGRTTFNRKNLVLSLADQDGGAHVDPDLNEDYANLSRNNSLNVYHEGKPVKGVVLASVRQIAFEAYRTLRDKYPEYF